LSGFDTLEARLRPNRRGALRKISERIASVERLRPWLVVTGVSGAFIAAFGKVFTGTAGIVLAITGAAIAAFGGGFVALLDYRKLELGTYLTEAEAIAEDAIAQGRALEAERDVARSEGETLDRRRIAYRQASNLMREAAEQSMLADVATLTSAADFMLKSAVVPIGAAIGFEMEERWAISIFQVQGEGDTAILRRIAGLRADRLAEQAQAREWRLNEGLVGVAWHTGRDGIIEDYRDPQVAIDYPVPDGQRRGYDPDRYRSMAAIPIRVGPDQTIWGVIAASSDCTGRFRRDPGNNRVQAVDTVRLIGRSTALLATAFRLRDNKA
jgi:hypothetical protein